MDTKVISVKPAHYRISIYGLRDDRDLLMFDHETPVLKWPQSLADTSRVVLMRCFFF